MNQYKRLCRRRGCCPEIAFADDPAAPYAASIRETGGGERAAAELSLTEEELISLARELDAAGYVTRARAEP